jgi:hypothetical protein
MLELVMRHFIVGPLSGEEVNPVQAVGESLAAVEEDRRRVLRFGFGGLWLFGLFSHHRRHLCHFIFSKPHFQ